MYKRRKKELHSVRIEVKFTPGQMDTLERALHVHSLKTGDYMPLSKFVRAGGMLKALTIIRDWNRRPKQERLERQAEYEAEQQEYA